MRERRMQGIIENHVSAGVLCFGSWALSLMIVIASAFAVAPAVASQVPAKAVHDTAESEAAERDEISDAALALEFDDEGFDDFIDDRVAFPDPFETFNRATLSFNRGVDDWVLDPVTDAYQYAVPALVRKSVRHFIANLDSPVVLVNDLLQRQWNEARTTVTRFAINSTFGVAGLFDPATGAGFEMHTSDFGQTLALEGVPSGPYVVLPVLGPTTVRDGAGDVIDLIFRPITFVLGPSGRLVYATLHGGGKGLAVRDEVADDLRMLEESSIDFYAALRNAYFQNRNAVIRQRGEDHTPIVEIASDWMEATTAGEVHASLGLPVDQPVVD